MDNRLSRLQISFPKGWIDISDENPDGPPTFINEVVEGSGVLQISMAQYISDKYPNPDFSDLIDLSKNIGEKNQFGTIQHEESGGCKFGKYGLVIFSRSDFPYIAVWHLSDGKSFIFLTFIAAIQPDQKQIDDVKDIVKSIRKKSLFKSLFK